jgi:glycosyltransferase involved in cell wall biosynthesis
MARGAVMAPLKLLLLYQGRNLPSSRVRVLNLLPELIRHGFDASAAEYPRNLRDKLRLLKELSGYDLVFLQKKMPCMPEAYLLRTFSAKLIFDFDDAIYMKDDNARGSSSRTRLNRFRNIIGKSDLVVAGNPILADFTVRFNPRVEVLPSAVPVEGVPVKVRGHLNERLVVGWVGGGRNMHHLAMIAAPLQRLSREIDFELRVVSDREFHADGVAVRNIPWSLGRQEAEIAQFDIGIMPLPKNDWTAGKCSYKLLQYMAAAVPVVATDWGFNSAVVKNGVTGYLAENPDDFYNVIKIMAANPEAARQMGIRGRLLVEKDYSIAAVGKRLAAIIRQLFDN